MARKLSTVCLFIGDSCIDLSVYDDPIMRTIMRSNLNGVA